MMTNDFEQAFSDFLEGKEYDEAENTLFHMARTAVLAGWNAAGGDPPQPHKILQVFCSQQTKKDQN